MAYQGYALVQDWSVAVQDEVKETDGIGVGVGGV